MNRKISAKGISLISLCILIVSCAFFLLINSTFDNYEFRNLFVGPIIISSAYLVCSFSLLFSDEEAVKKWFSFSLKWTVPLLILFLIVSISVINAGTGENDFLSYKLLFIPLLAVSGLFTLYTPFYLHKKSKELPNPTN